MMITFTIQMYCSRTTTSESTNAGNFQYILWSLLSFSLLWSKLWSRLSYSHLTLSVDQKV